MISHSWSLYVIMYTYINGFEVKLETDKTKLRIEKLGVDGEEWERERSFLYVCKITYYL